MSERASGQPRSLSGQSRSTLPNAADLLPPGADLPADAEAPAVAPPKVAAARAEPVITEPPRDSTEATAAWTAHPSAAPPISVSSARPAVIPPLVVDAANPGVRQLDPAERAQFRLWKNVILFGFFVGVLLMIFWLMARR